MDRWQGKVALVTGASAGIGAALVRELAKNGMHVAACARNIDRLKALQSELSGTPGSVLPIQCDLRDTAAIESMFQQIREKYGGKLHVCINNAGLGHNAPLLSGDTEEWRELFEVNVLALAVCTRDAVKMIRESGDDGHVIHISSMSGHRVETPGTGHFYAGTKHAVKAMTEGLRRELRTANSHIRVTCVSPGNVETEFSARMFAYDKELQAKMVNSPFKELESKDIVNSVVFALTAPPHCQIQDILIRPLEQTE